jgi:hypothetical protein
MASHKPKILALCKQIASEHEGWRFVGGKFVNKISKDAHFIINPTFVFKGSYMFFRIWGGVKLPKICKMVDKISQAHFKMDEAINEQLHDINLNSLTGSSFTFEGSKADSDELITQEMHRWINTASEYLTQKWPVDNYHTLFEAMKKHTPCYIGLYGVALNCLAAYLGKFDFVEQYFAGELEHADTRPIKKDTDERLLAILPEWKVEWDKTGTIKV